MKNSLKKVLSVVTMAALLMTSVIVASASSEVSITSNLDSYDFTKGSAWGITNLMSGAHKDDKYVENGLIVYTFSVDMDVSTLTPENIVLKAENKSEALQGLYSERYNPETKVMNYSAYSKSAREYSIDIGTLPLGNVNYTLTFTANEKTAAGETIIETTKNFRTGRIVELPFVQGKAIVDVAAKKQVIPEKIKNQNWTGGENNIVDSSNLVNPNKDFFTGTSQSDTYKLSDGVTIDLGNYYDIAQVRTTTKSGYSWQLADINVYASMAKVTPTSDSFGSKVGTISKSAFAYAANGDNTGGLGQVAALNVNGVRTRYLTFKSSGDAPTGTLQAFAYIDSDYGNMTAVKGEETVTNFNGAGTYVVSCPVKEYISGTGSAYMIFAGYDDEGKITKLVCEPVNPTEDNVTITAEFNSETVSAKATLFKSFSKPQMLTDALILSKAQ